MCLTSRKLFSDRRKSLETWKIRRHFLIVIFVLVKKLQPEPLFVFVVLENVR